MVIRDSDGKFVACRTRILPSLVDVKEAEALALRESLYWVASLNFFNVIFESDSKIIVDATNCPMSNPIEIDSLISSCISILNRLSSCKVDFVKRLANRVAHHFAQAASSYIGPFS